MPAILSHRASQPPFPQIRWPLPNTHSFNYLRSVVFGMLGEAARTTCPLFFWLMFVIDLFCDLATNFNPKLIMLVFEMWLRRTQLPLIVFSGVRLLCQFLQQPTLLDGILLLAPHVQPGLQLLGTWQLNREELWALSPPVWCRLCACCAALPRLFCLV